MRRPPRRSRRSGASSKTWIEGVRNAKREVGNARCKEFIGWLIGCVLLYVAPTDPVRLCLENDRGKDAGFVVNHRRRVGVRYVI